MFRKLLFVLLLLVPSVASASDQSLPHRGLTCYLPLLSAGTTIWDHSPWGNCWYNAGMTDGGDYGVFSGSASIKQLRKTDGTYDGGWTNPDMDFTTATSFMVTMEVYRTTDSGATEVLAGCDNTAGDIQWRMAINSSDQLFFSQNDGDSVETRTSTATIPLNTWTVVSVWWTGSQLRVKVAANSSQGSVTANAIGAFPTGGVIQIGDCAQTSVNGFTGRIRNVIIYRDMITGATQVVNTQQEAALHTATPPWTPAKRVGPTPVWGLIGQSNAAGRISITASTQTLLPASLTTARRGAVMVGEHGEGESPYIQPNPWYTGATATMKQYDDTAGPEYGLATMLQQGIVCKVTKGATDVEWNPGGTQDVRFRAALDALMTNLTAEGMNPFLAGVFNWQGLSDSNSESEANNFATRRAAQVASLRSYYGWFPWFEGRIKLTYDTGSWPYISTTRDQQDTVMPTLIRDFYLVDMDGTGNDASHEHSMEAIEGGRRFGLAWQRYVNKQLRMRYPVFRE